MPDHLQRVSELLVNLVESNDVSSSLFLLLIMFLVGAKVVEHVPHLAPWGKRSAFAMFLMYVVLRTAATIPQTAEELTMICLRGLLAAGFGCALAWILIPVLTILWTHSAGALLRRVQRVKESLVRGRAEQRSARQREQERQAADREWQKTAPQRERDRSEAAARARMEAESHAVVKKRLTEARLRCDVTFEKYARQLAASLPRERFAHLMDEYLNDHVPSDSIERHEQLLKEMLIESLGATHNPAPKFASLAELAAFFEARRREIENLPHDEDVRDTYLTLLNKAQDDAVRRFLKP